MVVSESIPRLDEVTINSQALISNLDDQLRTIPSVSEVAISTGIPPDRLFMTNNYTVEGEVPEPGGSQPSAEWIHINEAYYQTLGIPLYKGRTFTSADRANAPGVAIVNLAFARKHFLSEDPIGMRFKGGDWDPDAPWLSVIGVVGNVPYGSGAAGGIEPTVYVPIRQSSRWRTFTVLLRTTMDPTALVPQIRKTMTAIEPMVPLYNVVTMGDVVWEASSSERARSSLFLVLAAVALVLASFQMKEFWRTGYFFSNWRPNPGPQHSKNPPGCFSGSLRPAPFVFPKRNRPSSGWGGIMFPKSRSIVNSFELLLVRRFNEFS